MNTNFENKNVLIFGLGINQGGLGAAKFFAGQKAHVIVTDLKTKKELKPSLDELKKIKSIKYVLGEHRNEDIDWADLIIKNPAVKPGNKYIYYALKQKKTIQTDMGVFLKLVSPGQIIAITGTKGKSTTASLIYETLRNNLKSNVVFAGNIGLSVLDVVSQINKETIVVLEISSFQIEGIYSTHISPKYVVMTNIFQDHLNYHSSINSYIEAKRILAQYQKSSDFLFLQSEDQYLNNAKFISGLKGKLILFSKDDLPDSFKPTLPGDHNLSNYAASLAVAKEFGILENKALRTMNKFKGVDFRLQLIKDSKGIKIINDTTATGPDATVAALRTYPNSILIAGGQNANFDYRDLVTEIKKHAKAVYFLEGDATDEIIKLMQGESIIKGTFNDIGNLVKTIKLNIKKGDIILFSPGAKSFNLFQNEFERGRRFNEAIEKIF